MSINIVVATAFNIIILQNKKQLFIQYKYCNKISFTKHIFCQQKYTQLYYNYLQYQYEIHKKNAIIY